MNHSERQEKVTYAPCNFRVRNIIPFNIGKRIIGKSGQDIDSLFQLECIKIIVINELVVVFNEKTFLLILLVV